MATIYKSKGAVGSDSTDSGTAMPIAVVDHRLERYKVHYIGDHPQEIAPTSEFFAHVVVEVTELDEPRPDRFKRVGFYHVLGLHVKDAAFLLKAHGPAVGPWYVRTQTSSQATRYGSLNEAIAQVQRTVLQMHRDKTRGRTSDGKIALHYPDGSLFNVIWIEDEGGRVMRF